MIVFLYIQCMFVFESLIDEGYISLSKSRQALNIFNSTIYFRKS